MIEGISPGRRVECCKPARTPSVQERRVPVFKDRFGSNAALQTARPDVLNAADRLLWPMLIRKGAGLPMLFFLAGVIGGLIAFGLLGIFVGPTVLAIAHTPLKSWMAEIDSAPPSTVL